ncbi:MAG TPA: SRPBCC family protein [Planctomycetota bacterium]
MKPLVCSQHVAAPSAKVWSVFTDIPHAAENIPGITKIEMFSQGPFAVGTKWRETRKMFGKEAVETMWVTAVEPQRSYVVEAESHGAHYRSEFTFTEKDGGTDVAWSFGAEPTGMASKVMMAVMGSVLKGTMRRMLQADLLALKAVAEAQS